ETPGPHPNWSLMRGDVLCQGRYRLLEEVPLPGNQQNQGSAWLALDMRATRHRVLLHKLVFPNTIPGKTEQVMDALVKRLSVLSEHDGLPAITDVFQERGAYYLVQQYPSGESLASLMQKQGGALPERDVAEYGRQVCDMLTILAYQQPPIVHSSINPETIIVDAGTHQVSLIHLSLFPIKKLRQENTLITSYLAPEQARGGEVQPSSDLYSLAATMHHAVTGFDPRERMVFFYPPARRLNPLVTAGMEAILARQLRFSISQRYAKPEDMQKELVDLIASYPPPDKTLASTPNLASLQSMLSQNANQRKHFWERPSLIITATTIAILICLLVIIAPLISSSFTATNTSNAATNAAQIAQNQATLNNQMTLELQNFRKKGIGISDGRLTFDTYPGRVDTNLKEQAATALQQGNTSAAVNLLNQAINADPTDGEAQIYNEDIHIQQDNSPYVTLALGMPIDGSAIHLGTDREELEAVYLAQHETNNKNLLHNGTKLRIIIANSGANNADVATVAQFIANRVSQAGNLDHLIGVIGWYNSSQTINARDIIASVHLPIMAPTASSVKLSGTSPYFFRVAPPDNLQGQALGTLLINQLNAKRVLILSDPLDSYSVSLAQALASRIHALGGTFTVGHFTENTTTVDQYQQIVENNVNSATPASVIFLSGFNVDGVRLAHAVGNAARLDPANT
ncbi:MAG: ABC transporter substrate-binding protein, partial [Ktedonobacteraceae bacterium]|nr:ABC transporter substrate-binding protein [Ktedonobacteraceae bacterium]